MRKIVNYKHPGNKWWRKLNMIGCDHIPFLLPFSAFAYKKFNILLTGSVGTSKTTFCENLARALGKKYKTFDCDKLSHEYLQGDLDPEYMTRVPNAMNAVAEAIVKAGNSMVAMQSGLVTKPNLIQMPKISTANRLYVNGVDDYPGGFIVFDEIKRADPKQQALVLNIGSNRVFDGKKIDSYVVYATNTKYAELFEFSEALLSRMNLVIQFPSLSDMSTEERGLIIESTDMAGDEVAFNPELREKFDILSEALCPKGYRDDDKEPAWDPALLKEVKRFIHFLAAPLVQSMPDKMSTRYIKNAIRIFYIYFKGLEILEGKTFKDMDREELRNAYFSILPYTLYTEDMNDTQINQLHNACFLAFVNAYDKTKIRLHDSVKGLPEQSAIYLLWNKFQQEIRDNPTEGRDIAGIFAFLARVREYAKGNPALQYMLYKRLLFDIEKNGVAVEKDILDHFKETLEKHQTSVAEFLAKDNPTLEVSSEKLDPEFIEKVILASSERIVTSLTHDKSLYETLLTILMALTPEMVQSDTPFIQRCYDDLVQVMQL